VNVSPEPRRFSAASLPQAHAGAQLPLVSVVIVNFNYGRFLAQAADSVWEQTYPNVECIIVDNASTDETPEVLAGIIERHPETIVIRRARNDGQSPASLDGLAASHGSYVIFLDADDFLLPGALDLHVLAHLSMRAHVGFTSGDMLQVQGDQVVLSGGEEFNRYVRSRKGVKPNAVRPYLHAYDAWPDAQLAASLDNKLHYVPPLNNAWVWSPTSGNCYRRDALLLFSDCPPLAELRTGTDMFYAHGIGGLCGSVLIDEPVFAYRIHGGNIYSRRPQLDRVQSVAAGGSGDNNDRARRILVEHLVANVERFAPTSGLRTNFVRLLRSLDYRDDTPGLPRWQRRSTAAAALVRHYDAVSRAFGSRTIKLIMLVVFGVPLSVLLRLK
jgi:glycosyltransferase involved in cell wall biosynthesis